MEASLLDPAPLRAAYDMAPPVELFALPRVGTNNLIVGVRTGAGDFVWKIPQSFDDPAPLRREHALLTWLAGRGLSFAVPAPVPGRAGETLHRSGAGWGALFPLLPGVRPDHRDPAQVEVAGAALGELHGALADCPATMWPDLPAYGDLDRIHPAIPVPEALTPLGLGLSRDPAPDRALAWWREHLIGLRAFIAGPYRALPRQMIHGDFALGNVLWHEGRLAAVLDFEFASADARALDLASGLEFALRPWDGGVGRRAVADRDGLLPRLRTGKRAHNGRARRAPLADPPAGYRLDALAHRPDPRARPGRAQPLELRAPVGQRALAGGARAPAGRDDRADDRPGGGDAGTVMSAGHEA